MEVKRLIWMAFMKSLFFPFFALNETRFVPMLNAFLKRVNRIMKSRPLFGRIITITNIKWSRFVKETEHKSEGFSASLTLLFGVEFNYVEEHLVNCHTQRDEEELARRREKKAFQLITTKCSLKEPEQSCTIIKMEKIDGWQSHDVTYFVSFTRKSLVVGEV